MRAVFLDRDGTLNREIGFFGDPDRLELLPGVRPALERLRAAGFALVVVTNQSGIARGYYGERDLAAVHRRMQEQLGPVLRAFLHCPHHPDEDGPYGGPCDCRKPAPGLLHRARTLLGVDFEGSYLVGDSARDVLAARGLPLRTVHVRSGKPVERERAALAAAQFAVDAEVADLPAAVDWILADAAR
ncbi:MAG: D-glycero-alpha-D-manno-heptose-1,7-bisphosphate 7-phosphatase [Planctomycetota bacterium]